MTEPIVFDLAMQEVSYTIGEENYTLKEASGAVIVQYDNARYSKTRLTGGKVSGLGNMGDLDPLLVSLCLFLGDATVPVPLTVIKNWPSRIVKALAEKVKEISGLEIEDEEETIKDLEKRIEEMKAKEESEGNDSESTGDGVD